jgi:sigma-E factor negative regulatory protein RseA
MSQDRMSDARNPDEMREQLSALMDGELDRDAARFLLRRVDADTQLTATWERFHLARAALRRQGSLAAGDGFAARVMAQLADEPAPRTSVRFEGWRRLVAGGAIAAGVAVAALMLVRPEGRTPGQEPIAANASGPVLATPVPAPVVNDSLLQPRPLLSAQPAAATVGGGESTLGMDPRLQSYLIRHYEAAGGASRNGMAPYVLLVVPVQPEPQQGEAQPQRR